MTKLHAAVVLLGSLALCACTPQPAQDTGVTDPATVAADNSAPAAGMGTPATAPELPVRIGEATPPPVSTTTAGATPLNAASVYDAVANGMGEAAADIDVSVEGGIVSLKGSVKSEADYQAAHYIARALDGVDEVDASGLKVR